MSEHALAGIYVAAITPLKNDYSPDIEAIPALMQFYAERGCHGALLLGTTGEGPSFSPSERVAIYEAATDIKASHPEFRLLAGTGTPSLNESADLTKAAFNLGFDGVVVLPPYYFRGASEGGLRRWFQRLIETAVPENRYLLYYHIPGVSGVSVSLEFLKQLKRLYPNRFAGLKDSTGDKDFARTLGETFGSQLAVFTGNDRLLSYALEHHAAGAITAMANFASPQLREIWSVHQNGETAESPQSQLGAWRGVLENYQPYAPSLKALLAHFYTEIERWPAQLPLTDLSEDAARGAAQELIQATHTPEGFNTLRLPPASY